MKRDDWVGFTLLTIGLIGLSGVVIGSIGIVTVGWELLASSHGKMIAYTVIAVISIPFIVPGYIAITRYMD